MNDGDRSQIVPGISISSAGEAEVDAVVTPTLIDLAIQLDDQLQRPVDVEHIVAAILLAAQDGKLNPERHLSAEDEELRTLLARYVTRLLDRFGYDLGPDDS